jgi:hypothetical protein
VVERADSLRALCLVGGQQRVPAAGERAWEHAEELREEIAAVRSSLLSLAGTLQQVAGVGDLIHLPGDAPPSGGPPAAGNAT